MAQLKEVRGSLFLQGLQELDQSSSTDAIKIGRNLSVAPNGGNLVMPSGPILVDRRLDLPSTQARRIDTWPNKSFHHELSKLFHI